MFGQKFTNTNEMLQCKRIYCAEFGGPKSDQLNTAKDDVRQRIYFLVITNKETCFYKESKIYKGPFDSWPERVMSQVSHATVFLAAVWFVAIATAHHTFLAPCLTRCRLIFLPNIVTSVASIFLIKLSLVATVYRKLDVARSEPLLYPPCSMPQWIMDR
jgi:hypothetical protein